MKESQKQVIKYRTVPKWLIPFSVGVSVVFGLLWVGVQTDQYLQAQWEKQWMDAMRFGQPMNPERPELLGPISAFIEKTFAKDRPPPRPVDLRIGPDGPIEDVSYPGSIAPWEEAVVVEGTPTFGLGLGPNEIMFGLMAMAMLGVLVAAIGKENQVVMRKEGLSFPMGMAAELVGRINRTWPDVCAVSLIETANKENPDAAPSKSVRLYFQSGGAATLKFEAMSEQDVEGLLSSLEQWGSACALPPELIALKHKLFNKPGSMTHTAMWEEELRFHFAATNFIPLSIGRELGSGRFKIVMQLAAGGLSAVYLAEHTGKVVILKEAVVPPSTEEKVREKAKELFKREAQLLLKLDHPKIAKVLDHFVEEGRDYLVLEYVPGKSLRELVKREGPQSEETTLRWAAQIAEILTYMHGQDPPLVHRDLTPDNLVVTPNGEIRLIDFGAANEFVGAATGTLIGKQLYISPEQFRGKAEPASDLYSLGATLHFVLTGKEPEALSASHPKSVLATVSDRADAIVSRCTADAPCDRYASAAELYEAVSQQQTTGKPPVDQGAVLKVKEKVYEAAQ